MEMLVRPADQQMPTVLPADESREFFDRQARRIAGMPGDRFLA